MCQRSGRASPAGRTDERPRIDSDFQLDVHRGVEALQGRALRVVRRFDLRDRLDEPQGEAREDLHVVRHGSVGDCATGITWG